MILNTLQLNSSFLAVTCFVVLFYVWRLLIHSITTKALHILPHHTRDQQHHNLVNYGEELDNHVRSSAHRAEHRPKYETKEDNPQSISAGPETNTWRCRPLVAVWAFVNSWIREKSERTNTNTLNSPLKILVDQKNPQIDRSMRLNDHEFLHYNVVLYGRHVPSVWTDMLSASSTMFCHITWHKIPEHRNPNPKKCYVSLNHTWSSK